VSAAIRENSRPWISKKGARCAAVRTPYSFLSLAASVRALATPDRSGGVISAVNGRLKTVFRRVPDVPVRKFVLTMKGGNRGLLVNSENLCARRQFAKLNLKAHNGKKKVNNRLRLRLDPCR